MNYFKVNIGISMGFSDKILNEKDVELENAITSGDFTIGNIELSIIDPETNESIALEEVQSAEIMEAVISGFKKGVGAE